MRGLKQTVRTNWRGSYKGVREQLKKSYLLLKLNNIFANCNCMFSLLMNYYVISILTLVETFRNILALLSNLGSLKIVLLPKFIQLAVSDFP